MSLLGYMFGKQGQGTPTLAVAALENGTLRAAGFWVDEKHEVRIVKSATVAFSKTPTPPQRLAEAGEITRAIRSALKALGSANACRALALSLGEDVVRGMTFHAVFERQRPQEKIDSGELKNFFEKAGRQAREEVERAFRAGSGEATRFLMLDSHLLDFALDGYHIADPVGLTGKELAINLFTAYSEALYVEFLEDIRKSLKLSAVQAVSPAYALYRALRRGQASETFSRILICLGARETSVSVIAKGNFFGVKTFTIGEDAFTRRISLSLALDVSEAAKVKAQHAEGVLGVAVAKKVSGILKPDIEIWARSVGLALEEFSYAVELFPLHIYLVVSGLPCAEVITTLQGGDDFFTVPFLEKRTVEILTPQMLPCLARTDEPSVAQSDTVLAAIACFLAEEHTQRSELHRLLRQAMYLANR